MAATRTSLAADDADRGVDRPKSDPVLIVERVSKAFGGVNALTQVNIALEPSSVHAVIGHNGAGKSTLMNVISGVVQPDAGRLILNGFERSFREPRDAQNSGIAMVHQELSVIEDLDVAENIFLGREPITRSGLLDRGRMDRSAHDLLEKLNLDLPVRAFCRSLSVGDRQMIEIARALSSDARVLILDEPTAALTHREQEALFKLIAHLKTTGVGILYISHRLDEIIALADTVSVLRDGRNAGHLQRGAFDHARLVEMMLGRSIEREIPPEPSSGKLVIEVKGLQSNSGRLQGIDLSVREGEVVGLVGMLGSGRSELFECLFGVRRFETGEIRLHGTAYCPRSPLDALARRIGLVPEDRKGQGIFTGTSLWWNVAIASVRDRFNRLGLVNATRAQSATEDYVAKLDIRTRSIEQDIDLLSGGNQQKAVLARWIMREPELLLLDDPTAGIDVGAKSEIHRLIKNLARDGVAIVISSSEFDELIGLCHRILVVRDGRIVDEVEGRAATQRGLVLAATGGHA